MSEWFKEAIRRILFFLPLPDEWVAEPGTMKYLFLNWLYGPGEPEFDVIMPDDSEGELKP